MKNIEIEISNSEATLYFNGLLEENDFLLYWRGIDPENNDGSDGVISDTLKSIYDIYEQAVMPEKFTDFQVWGPVNGGSEPSYAKHIDLGKIPYLVNRLTQKFGYIDVVYSGTSVKLDYENYREVENCLVVDDIGTENFVGRKKEVFTLVTDDRQHSHEFIAFDNNTVIQYTHKGCWYISGLSLVEELEMYKEAVENGETDTIWSENIEEEINNRIQIQQEPTAPVKVYEFKAQGPHGYRVRGRFTVNETTDFSVSAKDEKWELLEVKNFMLDAIKAAYIVQKKGNDVIHLLNALMSDDLKIFAEGQESLFMQVNGELFKLCIADTVCEKDLSIQDVKYANLPRPAISIEKISFKDGGCDKYGYKVGDNTVSFFVHPESYNEHYDNAIIDCGPHLEAEATEMWLKHNFTDGAKTLAEALAVHSYYKMRDRQMMEEIEGEDLSDE